MSGTAAHDFTRPRTGTPYAHHPAFCTTWAYPSV